MTHSTTTPADGRFARADGPLFVAVAFFVTATVLWWVLPIADDEGLLALLNSTSALEHPIAVLLLQKYRPAGALLNMPAAALGWQAYNLWHLGVAALAVLLLGRVAKHWGASGWLASLVLACSPAFLTSALTGQSNSDGLAMLTIGLYLMVVADRPFAAGIFFGAMPWVRYEYLPFAIVMAAYALVTSARRRRVFYGMTVFPGLLLLSGAVYHRDLLWWLTYPPTLLTPGPDSYFLDDVVADADYLAKLPGVLLQVTPAWALPLIAPWRRMQRLEKVLLLALAVSFTLMIVLPFFKILNFEHSPRYVMVVLPLMALTIARVASDGFPPGPGAAGLGSVAGAFAVTALLMVPSLEGLARAATIAAPGLVVATGLNYGRRAFVSGIAICAALGLALLTAGPSMNKLAYSASTDPGIEQVTGWLSRDGRGQRARVIFTNDKALHLHLREHLPELAPRVHLLYQFDSAYELYALGNRENGQLADVIDGMTNSMYGTAAWPCDLATRDSFADTLLVLDDDYRLLLTYPQPFLDSIATEVAVFDRMRILEGKAPPPEGYATLPMDDWMRDFCRVSRWSALEGAERVDEPLHVAP